MDRHGRARGPITAATTSHHKAVDEHPVDIQARPAAGSNDAAPSFGRRPVEGHCEPSGEESLGRQLVDSTKHTSGITGSSGDESAIPGSITSDILAVGDTAANKPELQLELSGITLLL